MMGRRIPGILFIFWLFIATLSASWIFFSVLNDISLIFLEPIYFFVFIISCLGFLIAVFTIHEIMNEVKSKINGEKEKQKNVKDFYQYVKLLDPPDKNMNN